jgi:hypothetical protein
MTVNAIFTGIVFIRVYTRQIFSLAGRIGQVGMASQTEGSVCVDSQRLRIVRMINCRSVTVFALYDGMRRFKNSFYVFFVTFLTVFPAAVFNLEMLPVFRGGEAVKIVGKGAALFNSEIGGYHEVPYN